MPNLIHLQPPFAQGSEHRVCEAADPNDNAVYKIPFAWWHSKGADALKQEMDVLSSNGVNTLETEVLESPQVMIEDKIQNPPYVLRQIKSSLPTLNATHLHVQFIRTQLGRLLQTSVDLFHEQRVAIDFLGAESMTGLMKYFMSRSYPLHVHNFRLDQQARILLSDTGMLNPERCKPYLRWGIAEIINLQHLLLEGVIKKIDSDFHLEGFDPSMLVRFTGNTLLTLTSVWAGMKSY